jgi:hypothetical protein
LTLPRLSGNMCSKKFRLEEGEQSCKHDNALVRGFTDLFDSTTTKALYHWHAVSTRTPKDHEYIGSEATSMLR